MIKSIILMYSIWYCLATITILVRNKILVTSIDAQEMNKMI